MRRSSPSAPASTRTPPGWGGYPVDDAARRRGAGVEAETTEAAEAYASVPGRQPTAHRKGWLPDPG